MSERSVCRPWSDQEDALLKEAVQRYGENDNWKNIATIIPGRTNKACRKRWLHSLSPSIKKTSWEQDEDLLLLRLYSELGPKWSAIARNIPGRTDDACSKRYREALDPNLKKDEWTQDEDLRLTDAYRRHGNRWQEVGQELRRGGLACRNRWRLLERKKHPKAGHSNANTCSPVMNIPMIPEIPEIPELLGEQPQETISHDLPFVMPPAPYYPRESYPPYPDDSHGSLDFSLRENTPEPLDIPNPLVAPFQFTSSSLCAALSDPPRPSLALPLFSVENTPELVMDQLLEDQYLQQSLSPLSQPPGTVEMIDNMMLLDHPEEATSQQHIPSMQLFESDPFHFGSDYGYFTASPMTIPSIELRAIDPVAAWWKTRSPVVEYNNSPTSIFSFVSDPHDEVASSTTSTPFGFPSPLSPSTSPESGAHVDLPANGQVSTGSLLFSPAGEPRQHELRRQRKQTRKHTPMILSTTNRLSSQLALSKDPSIRPYSCGHPSCWPESQEASINTYMTSGYLFDHWKEVHSEHSTPDTYKPFRCGLAGCNKGWKSINGLQYHLQMSPAHYSSALASRFSNLNASERSPVPGKEAEPDGSEDRRFVCPRPGCYKAYRQPSGLRYHIKHGHPTDMPTQLDEVPPALERQIPNKAKKLRVKTLTEPIATS